MTGFDRMLADKLKWAKNRFSGGYMFAFIGVGNIMGYALSNVMDKSNYDYYFAYTGCGKFMQPIKSLFGSNKILNVAYIAPTLIVGGVYLHRLLGPLLSTKFFGLSILATYGFMSAFGANTRVGAQFNIRGFWPSQTRWDCFAEDNSSQMGADVLAGCVVYMYLFYFGWWKWSMGKAMFDIAYYGP